MSFLHLSACRICCSTSLPPSGILACLDGYMNIAMEQTEEYVNGQLKNKYGDCFIRGNNGTFHICVSKVVQTHGKVIQSFAVLYISTVKS